eukprot:SAG31_NODE_4165_length_3518_cov_5.005850_4_plen_71_part_00
MQKETGTLLCRTFLVVSNEGLGNRLADSIDLRYVAPSFAADPNVNHLEFVLAKDEDRFVHLSEGESISFN